MLSPDVLGGVVRGQCPQPAGNISVPAGEVTTNLRPTRATAGAHHTHRPPPPHHPWTCPNAAGSLITDRAAPAVAAPRGRPPPHAPTRRPNR
ncbi:hypothetical protein SCATT_p05440 (plasmid) [Streptantibioticus cattleyicolor NRRL 8057 = DSM 46488]|uniref:Uncharacterized protein n=1 Tax=Streptantibioticus cattleyicolor (strain ATCC 35852 / DSM 46488 / JCM 4925 / NBRC 14057 / NRRL 8057) TaxID=1003195 RepID=G8XGI0_STREN|nr:hypothetical protein SCATT_p05440 [Streptantibioticus cattleyicolor NRRL 8057 = DSM 46488]